MIKAFLGMELGVVHSGQFFLGVTEKFFRFPVHLYDIAIYISQENCITGLICQKLVFFNAIPLYL